MSPAHRPAEVGAWRARLFEIIFEADSPGGKALDAAPTMILDCGIIALATGMVTVETARHGRLEGGGRACPGSAPGPGSGDTPPTSATTGASADQ